MMGPTKGAPMGKHNNRRRAAAHAAVVRLVETFPTAFFRTDRKPLKLGIHDDLLARGVAADVATKGLASYCSSTGYLNATKAGAARIDLDGNEVGTVTAEEAEHAAQKLAAAAERAKVMLANAAKAAEEQARAAQKGRAAAKASGAGSPAPAARAPEKQQQTAPRPPTGPVTKRAPVVVVRKTRRRPGR
jgi:sRNA-binding protein